MVNKVANHYKLSKKKKVNGYAEFVRELKGEIWVSMIKITDTVSTGDLEDDYIENWQFKIINYDPIAVGDVLLVDNCEYVVENVDNLRNVQYVRTLKTWRIRA